MRNSQRRSINPRPLLFSALILLLPPRSWAAPVLGGGGGLLKANAVNEVEADRDRVSPAQETITPLEPPINSLSRVCQRVLLRHLSHSLSLTHSHTLSPSPSQGMTEGIVEVSHYYMQRNDNHDTSAVGSLVQPTLLN